jgi:hypothetical protein
VNERKYVPRKNSAPYAIVITLYRYDFVAGLFYHKFDIHKTKELATLEQRTSFNERKYENKGT